MIQVEQGLILSLQFTAFDTEPCSNLCCDHLTITDGDGTILMEKSCGITLPADITSTSNIVKLVFSTDSSATRSGWSVSWSAVTPGECQQYCSISQCPMSNIPYNLSNSLFFHHNDWQCFHHYLQFLIIRLSRKFVHGPYNDKTNQKVFSSSAQWPNFLYSYILREALQQGPCYKIDSKKLLEKLRRYAPTKGEEI